MLADVPQIAVQDEIGGQHVDDVAGARLARRPQPQGRARSPRRGSSTAGEPGRCRSRCSASRCAACAGSIWRAPPSSRASSRASAAKALTTALQPIASASMPPDPRVPLVRKPRRRRQHPRRQRHRQRDVEQARRAPSPGRATASAWRAAPSCRRSTTSEGSKASSTTSSSPSNAHMPRVTLRTSEPAKLLACQSVEKRCTRWNAVGRNLAHDRERERDHRRPGDVAKRDHRHAEPDDGEEGGDRSAASRRAERQRVDQPAGEDRHEDLGQSRQRHRGADQARPALAPAPVGPREAEDGAEGGPEFGLSESEIM